MTLSRVTIQASALESRERTGGDILHRSLGLVGLEQGGNAQSDVMFQEQGAYIQTTPSQKSNGIVVPLIPKEQTGGVADRVYFHYENPDVTMRSYAAVTLEDTNGSSYCSGTMIGPNVMMTAAHCGQGNTNAVFRLYTASNTQMTESFACQYLLHTFSDSDLTLYWCSANASGENPGDKYGYDDFDIVINPTTGFDYTASRNLRTLSTNLYSIWMNPIADLGPGWYSIYSEGTFDNIDFAHWFTPNVDNGAGYLCGNDVCSGGSNPGANCTLGACGQACNGGTCTGRETRALAVHSTLWANGGASGSSQLRASSHRILVGPMSVGPSDARGRSAMGIADYLYWAITDANLNCQTCCLSCSPDQINRPLLTTLGIANPAFYYGWVDGNADGLFDVQHDIEMIRGENSRDWYWLGFESHRRNSLWTIHAPAVVTFDTADPATGTATLSTLNQSGSGYLPVLSHERFNLQANQFYRISFTMLLTLTQATNNPIRVCLEGTETQCADSNPSVGSWLTHVSRLWASPGAKLRFYLQPGTQLALAGVSLISDTAQMNFDSHDKRFMWRNHNTGSRGRVWPNGVNSATVSDWAGTVYRDNAQPLSDDWSLRNRQLAIGGGATYRVCFQHKSSTRNPLTGNIQGTTRLLNEFGLVAGSTLLFAPGTNWQQTCTGWFYVPTDDNNLQFGIQAGDSNASGTYLVDSVQIERQAPDTVYVDWRSQDFREEGTLAYPFNTVTEGAGVVGQNGFLSIASGSYPERLTIHSPMTLQAPGGSVVIGQ
jgi:hypothetical protein